LRCNGTRHERYNYKKFSYQEIIKLGNFIHIAVNRGVCGGLYYLNVVQHPKEPDTTELEKKSKYYN